MERLVDFSFGQLTTGTTAGSTANTVTNDSQARDVARQFEALLVQTMLKNMRAATPSGGLFDSEQADMYLEMFDQKVSQEISKTGGFGLQESIYRQLTSQNSMSVTDRSVQVPSAGLRASLRSIAPVHADFFNRDDSPAGFVQRLRSAASATAAKLGTAVEAVIAVAALETGWGKRVATTADGKSTYNLFGIKADKRWYGESSEVQTQEFRDGEMRSETASFRVYRSEQASVRDFGDFLLQNPRYKSALEASSNPEQFIRELQKAGYATDPDYSEKVISVMQSINELIAAPSRDK